MKTLNPLTFVATLALCLGLGIGTALAQDDAAAEAAYAEMEEMLGIVPTFMKAFPKVGVAPAWAEMKAVQMNPDTALSGKEKELIGLAVAAQIPCEYCIYFHTKGAKANGATDEEIREAIAMAAITRHWSTVLNGFQVDFSTYRKETDEIFAHGEKTGKSEGKETK